MNKEADFSLTGDIVISSLVAGASLKATMQRNIPMNTPIGRYYVKVCADNRNDITENNEDNNCKASTSKIRVK